MPNKTLKKGAIQKGFKKREDDIEDFETEEGTLLEEVEESLRKDGIILFNNEDILEDYLSLPADLTEVHSKELGRYFTTFTKQKLWVRTMLGRTRAYVRELDEKLDIQREQAYAILPAKVSVKEKELSLRGNKKALKFLEQISFYEEKLQILADYLDNLVDAITCISREITRREGDFGDEIRENSINKKRGKK